MPRSWFLVVTAAIKGKNAFLCMVERSWTAPIDDADFWNPKLRAPICFNAPAAHSHLRRTIKKTELILAGRTKAQMMEAIVAAIDKKELPENGTRGDVLHAVEAGLLEQPRWALASSPHVLLFFRRPAAWAANLPGSPIFAFNDTWEHLTIFLIPVRQWSDGTADRSSNN